MRDWDGFAPRGFSLVEIAIVLVVVGLLVSGGLLGISPVLQANKVNQTEDKLDRIEQALTLYVIQNGCLPCPASPTTITGQSLKGATPYPTGCGTAVPCTNTQGLVPWVNLGLSRADVIDPYGSFLDYATGTSVTLDSTSMVRTPPSTYPAGNLVVNDATTPTQNQQTALAAYVLVSHGADGSHGFAANGSGTQRADPNSSTLQTSNQATGGGPYAASTTFVQSTAIGGATTGRYFDDIVRYKTAPVIIQGCGTNACGNPA